MQTPKYIRVNGNKATIDFNTIPDKAFLDAVQTKRIAHIKIMSRKAKIASKTYKAGQPDIIIKDIADSQRLITRNELTKNYKRANGTDIKLAYMKSDTSYLVVGKCEEQCKIFKLPANCNAVLPSGKTTKMGSYIIARIDTEGNIIRQSIVDLDPRLFRKSFRVPMQLAIRRNIGKSREFTSILPKRRSTAGIQHRQNVQPMQPRIDTAELGMNPDSINIPSANDRVTSMQRPNQAPGQPRRQFVPKMNTVNNQANTNYKYKVLNKITDINGKLVGFTVQHIETGNTKKLKINDVMNLCANKSVENVMIVRNPSGSTFLKGNGCSLESMPSVIM